MKIISVYFDDYDKPLIGRIAAYDKRVERLCKQLGAATGENFVVEVEDSDSPKDIIAHMNDINGDDSEESPKVQPKPVRPRNRAGRRGHRP